MNKKTKKFWIGFSIGAGVTVLLLVAAVVVLIHLFLYGPPAKTTRSVEKYNTIFTQKGVHTGYLVFPEEVPESAQEITFYNYYRDTWNAPTVQTYLQCTYDDNTYEQELDRLENTSKTYGKDRKVLLRDEQGREIITGCAFVKYNDDEVTNEINYDDINGMQYMDMELNKDRTAMTVTYMNGAEEKQITYDLKE